MQISFRRKQSKSLYFGIKKIERTLENTYFAPEIKKNRNGEEEEFAIISIQGRRLKAFRA